MQNSITEIIAAICAGLSAIGALYGVVSNTKTKNAIAQRDAETKSQLALIQAETTATKERADYTAQAVVASKEERRSQLAGIERKIDASTAASETALVAANGHKATIAENTQQLVELRHDLNKVANSQA